MAFLCIQCSNNSRIVEFPTLKQLNEHSKAGHPIPSWVQEKENSPKVRVPKKKGESILELAYKFIGSCPECGSTEIDTLKVSLEKHLEAMIAYCTVCRKQLREQKVLPIKEQ